MEYSSTIFSDEVLAIVIPIFVYWAYSGFYALLGSYSDKYRLHPREEEKAKNLVSKRSVAITVLSQQLIQSVVQIAIFKTSGINHNKNKRAEQTSILVLASQFFVAMFIFDTWMYMGHRYMHLNKFLYKHIHSWHHRLVVPYTFGSQYNHPLEGLLLDTVAGGLALIISGMSPRTTIYFFSFSIIKGIDDHCGILLPWNPFHIFFWNSTAFHDVHHQLYGSKHNFSVPFFVFWDKVMGTYLPFTIEEREGGGLEARLVKEKNY